MQAMLQGSLSSQHISTLMQQQQLLANAAAQQQVGTQYLQYSWDCLTKNQFFIYVVFMPSKSRYFCYLTCIKNIFDINQIKIIFADLVPTSGT